MAKYGGQARRPGDPAGRMAPLAVAAEQADETVGSPADFQRLDKFLWCARFAAQRTSCTALAAGGLVRINRQPTDKPHAKVRVGDVLTVPLGGGVRVIRVLALTDRRGPAPAARALYEELA